MDNRVSYKFIHNHLKSFTILYNRYINVPAYVHISIRFKKINPGLYESSEKA
jgi:hypothetical protein